jgi:hypothetical protein
MLVGLKQEGRLFCLSPLPLGLVLAALFVWGVAGMFYLPGVAPMEYLKDDDVEVKGMWCARVSGSSAQREQ